VKISGSQTIPVPPERAYQLLQDPEVLAQCMPGCESLEKTGEDTYAMRMNMMMAAFTGRFDGSVRIADRNPPESFQLIVEGKGKVGFMKGQGLLRLSETAEGTGVAYDGDVQVGGTIAAVGQRLIDSTARMMIRRFFDKLVQRAGSSAAQ